MKLFCLFIIFLLKSSVYIRCANIDDMFSEFAVSNNNSETIPNNDTAPDPNTEPNPNPDPIPNPNPDPNPTPNRSHKSIPHPDLNPKLSYSKKNHPLRKPMAKQNQIDENKLRKNDKEVRMHPKPEDEQGPPRRNDKEVRMHPKPEDEQRPPRRNDKEVRMEPKPEDEQRPPRRNDKEVRMEPKPEDEQRPPRRNDKEVRMEPKPEEEQRPPMKNDEEQPKYQDARKSSVQRNIPMNCIKDKRTYCNSKFVGFKFNDGCHNCECKSKLNNFFKCGEGPCKYYVRSFEEAVDYCSNIEKENKIAYDAQKLTQVQKKPTPAPKKDQKKHENPKQSVKTLKHMKANPLKKPSNKDMGKSISKIGDVKQLNKFIHQNQAKISSKILTSKLGRLSSKHLIRNCIYRIAYNELTIKRINDKIRRHKISPKGKLGKSYMRRLKEIRHYNNKMKRRIVHIIRREKSRRRHQLYASKFSKKKNLKRELIKLQNINNELRNMKSGVKPWFKNYGHRRPHRRHNYRRRRRRYWKAGASVRISIGLLILPAIVMKLIGGM